MLKQWQATPCQAEITSAWSMEQNIWRIWIALHFLPVAITQHGRLRKTDLKKIAAVLHENEPTQLEPLVFSMLRAGLLAQNQNILSPCPVDWSDWRQTMYAGMLKILRGWKHWDQHDEQQAIALLTQLPTNCWLKLDEIIEWLQTEACDNIISADWMGLFTQHPNHALHHLNMSQRSINLLPQFQAVLQHQPIIFNAPGWHGADANANVSGFLSAASDIQLTPDCNHRILTQLAACCSIRSVEQMITLRLDEHALQRIGTDKDALKKTRTLLESLQSPLPKAMAYQFDKLQTQQPLASVAATAMVILLHDAAAIHKLQATGFEFTQPFNDRPEIVLLDASADSHAFVQACNDAGILLDTLIKPVQWISGTAAINAWMDINIDREDQWLEISYQKTRNSQTKQIIARIDADYYGAVRIQPTRKAKQRYSLLKTTVQLQPKHVLRLRELDSAEVNELGLDQLQ